MDHPIPGPGDTMKPWLNLGCGDRYAPGWWNVDHGCPLRKDEDVDLDGPLPWAPGLVDLVYMGHLLEHLTLGQGLRLLERLLPCMTETGVLMVVGPDVPKARAMARAGTLDVTLDELRLGAHRWPGDEHQWECDPSKVMEMLIDADWQEVTGLPIGKVPDMWPVADRGPAWQFAITARV
jgi:predicted SAM-dependent methyltransferase